MARGVLHQVGNYLRQRQTSMGPFMASDALPWPVKGALEGNPGQKNLEKKCPTLL